jgi:hypothetical protein
MVHKHKHSLDPDHLQEYLEALAESIRLAPNDAQKLLLLSFAEFQFRLRGGGRCVLCGTHVRHVLPIEARQKDGLVFQYSCLCQRCLAGEVATATAVVSRVGTAVIEHKRKSAADAPPQGRRFHIGGPPSGETH